MNLFHKHNYEPFEMIYTNLIIYSTDYRDLEELITYDVNLYSILKCSKCGKFKCVHIKLIKFKEIPVNFIEQSGYIDYLYSDYIKYGGKL